MTAAASASPGNCVPVIEDMAAMKRCLPIPVLLPRGYYKLSSRCSLTKQPVPTVGHDEDDCIHNDEYLPAGNIFIRRAGN